MNKIKIIILIIIIILILLIMTMLIKNGMSSAICGDIAPEPCSGARSYYMSMSPYWYGEKFPEEEFIPKNSELFVKKILLGKQKMYRSKIVITGLARDIEPYIIKNLNMLSKIGEHFKDYRIIIFENDSKDNTRELIKKYNNQKIYLLNDPNTKDGKLNWEPALLKYMQMHAFAYILTRLFIAMQ